jgi:hypothetical protein
MRVLPGKTHSLPVIYLSLPLAGLKAELRRFYGLCNPVHARPHFPLRLLPEACRFGQPFHNVANSLFSGAFQNAAFLPLTQVKNNVTLLQNSVDSGGIGQKSGATRGLAPRPADIRAGISAVKFWGIFHAESLRFVKF